MSTLATRARVRPSAVSTPTSVVRPSIQPEVLFEPNDDIPAEFGRWVKLPCRGDAVSTRVMLVRQTFRVRARDNQSTVANAGQCVFEKQFSDGTIHRYVLSRDCINAVFPHAL